MRSAADRVVTDLLSAGLVDPTRAAEARTVVRGALESPDDEVPATRTLLIELGAYVGGALVLVAAGLFLADRWPDLSEAYRTAVLAGITLCLAAAGAAVRRSGAKERWEGRAELRAKLASTLLTGSALAAAVTVGQRVEVSMGDTLSSWPVLAAALTMLVGSLVAYAVAPSVLGPLAVAAAGFTAVLNGWAVLTENDAVGDGTLGPGLAVLALGLAYLAAVERRVFAERVLGRAVGAGLVLLGAQQPLFEGGPEAVAYLFTAATAAAGVAAYLRTVSWPYLALGVAAITLVVPEAVTDWTGGELGPAGGVLLAGLTLLGASVAALRVRREATGQEQDPSTVSDPPAPRSEEPRSPAGPPRGSSPR